MTTPGVRSLRKLQLYKESTSGVSSTATTIWRGEGTLEDTQKVNFPSEDVGLLSLTDRQNISILGGKLVLSPVTATYEQLPYIMTMGIKSLTSGVQDGAGSGYVYDYPLATTAQNTVQTYTIEGGDDFSAEKMVFSFCTDFQISGKAGEEVKMEATLEGRSVTTASFSTGLSVPSVSDILTSQGKFYIDAVGGSLGATQKTGTLLDFALKVKTGFQSFATADGNLYFTALKQIAPEVLLDITFEHETAADAEKVFWRAGTARQWQLKFVGPALQSTGTSYANKTLIISLSGKYEKFEAMSDDNGDDIIKATIRGRYNSTAALFADIKVVNELSALT